MYLHSRGRNGTFGACVMVLAHADPQLGYDAVTDNLRVLSMRVDASERNGWRRGTSIEVRGSPP